ncbi:MAG: vanadium-dependent haloperoxidase [Candidatus Dadabacteria bacterium]
MKLNSTSLFATLTLVIFISFLSCKKEFQELPAENTPLNVNQSKRPLDPGFAENDMVLYWNEKVATVLGVGMNQPTRSRYFAIIEIAVHDALNSIKPKYESYALHEREQHANPDAAVASAVYWAIKGLNRQGSFPVDTWYNESLASIADGESKDLGIAIGKKAADAMIANRANDGFTQVLTTSVNPPDGSTPGAYRHTNLLNVRYVPNWGTVMQPYVVLSNDQFRPAGPYSVSSAEYAADYNEVKAKGARVRSTRTTQEETLAKFWSENRPSIIWNNLARAVVATKKMDAWKTARLFALIHTAIADGVNTALNSAYYYYYWRPETAIHEGNNDGNSATTADATWIPFIVESANPIAAAYYVTPPIPEYPSTYAMMGSAVTEILKDVFETDDIDVNLTSFSLTGVAIHYSSLDQASRDNALGKMYAGWHFRKSVIDGEETGKRIADYIFTHQFREQ